MFNILDLASGWKADIIICKDRAFSRQELARRLSATVAGIETWIASPEDSILSKLEWYARSGSERQRRDVLAMLVANLDTIDRSYLERWAAELGVADALEAIWAEAEHER